MADGKLIFEIVAEGKNIKLVQKQTDKLAESVEDTHKARDKSTKSQDKYNKLEKGIHQTNLSSAKGFSKMNQTLGGSSGLVGAYATLAANIFAATAAFNALKRAAQLNQLIEGLKVLGSMERATPGESLTGNPDEPKAWEQAPEYTNMRDALDFINDPEAYYAGLGYEECNDIMNHNSKSYDEEGNPLVEFSPFLDAKGKPVVLKTEEDDSEEEATEEEATAEEEKKPPKKPRKQAATAKKPTEAT